MKLALLSDVHGNLPALEAVLADARRRGADRIVNLGDSLAGPLLPRETAEFLMRQTWVQLLGNHDREVRDFDPAGAGASARYARSRLTPAALEWLGRLPETAWLDDRVFLCHGTPESDVVYLLETVDSGRVRPATADEAEERVGITRARVIACGHTHVPRMARTRGGALVVNPGSVGLPAYTSDDPSPHVVETGSPDARYAIVEDLANDFAVALLAVPYDFGSMAALAHERERPDWESALRTGYVATDSTR